MCVGSSRKRPSRQRKGCFGGSAKFFYKFLEYRVNPFFWVQHCINIETQKRMQDEVIYSWKNLQSSSVTNKYYSQEGGTAEERVVCVCVCARAHVCISVNQRRENDAVTFLEVPEISDADTANNSTYSITWRSAFPTSCLILNQTKYS